MPVYEWKPFLDQWSRAVLESPDLEAFGLPPDVIASGWLGYPPATEDQIAAAESRLGVSFPPSYRSFLRVTNGWRHTGMMADRILPVEGVNWFREIDPEWIALWLYAYQPGGDLPVYDSALDPVNYQHLPKTLAVSEEGDLEILLLNPEVISPEGEWEAWLFVDTGAERYPSFWDMLHAEYEALLIVNRESARQVRSSEPSEAVVQKLPGLIDALEEKLAEIASRSSPDDIGYHQGTADGIQAALTRIKETTANITDPGDLRARLRQLAADLNAEAEQVEGSLKGLANTGLATLLKGNLGDMLGHMNQMIEGVQHGAHAQGLRVAAQTIRWYLDEQ